MGELISLGTWKKNKELEELDELEQCVQEIIDNIDLSELEPKSFYVSHGMSGYDDVGVSSEPMSTFSPNIRSCCATLAWISYTLVMLGETDEANKIDNIVTRLERKEKT